MTYLQYQKLYKDARTQSGNLMIAARKELLKSYRESAQIAGDAVKSVTLSDLEDLTSSAWDTIKNALSEGGAIVSRKTEEIIPDVTRKAYANFADVDNTYIMDAVESASVSIITLEGLQRVTGKISDNMIIEQASRLDVDGRTFSERIWDLFHLDGTPAGVNGDYQYRIRAIIDAGLNQGRDAVDIARDIQEYVRRGKLATFTQGRYGRLVPGTPEYILRISRTVDWRALRLSRSELYRMLQDSQKQNAIMNPACNENLVNWKKTQGNAIDVDGSRNASGRRCIDLEDGNPYKVEDAPGFQHPNDSCTLVPVLMDQRQFVEDLRNWDINSNEPEYLSSWYRNVYSNLNT